MTKFKRYDSYINSGIEWLGEIPSHWEILKTKYAHKNIKFLNTNRICDNVLSLTLRGVVNNNIDNPEGLVPKDYATYQIFEKNDLVFKLIDLENISTSRVGIVHEKGIMSSAYIRLKIGKTSIPKFAYYYYYSLYINNVYNNIGCGVRSTLNPTDLLNIKFPLPPKDEQEKIASYLDEKIAKIDASISGKEKFIELLKEQKQIIINDAVTKGLNKNTKFKNSGVEWLGEIPSHWEILANKYIFKLKRNLVGKRSNKYVLLSLTLDGIVERDLDKGGKFPAEFDTYQEVKNGDFVFCLFDVEETPRTIGLSEYDGMITGAYTVFDVRNVSKKYLYYFYLNLDNNKRLKPLYLGLRNTISKENFFSFKTFIPPKDEQIQIVEYIENKIAKIDKLLNLEQECTKSLKEYKASLIDSVVTGKVKV